MFLGFFVSCLCIFLWSVSSQSSSQISGPGKAEAFDIGIEECLPEQMEGFSSACYLRGRSMNSLSDIGLNIPTDSWTLATDQSTDPDGDPVFEKPWE